MNEYMKLYSEDAINGISEIRLSGRREFLKYPLKRIVGDVAAKLELKPTDSLLDIGCNCGQITIPISFLCDHVTGIDGEGVIERLRKRSEGISNIDTIVGDFLDVDIQEKFDCILVYGVLCYIDSYDDKVRFIKKACNLLKSGGRMIVGDVINTSVQQRFHDSDYGKRIDEQYREQLNSNVDHDDETKQNSGPPLNHILNDETLMRLLLEIRKFSTPGGGYESFLLPQSHNMAFGCTRQDILVKAW